MSDISFDHGPDLSFYQGQFSCARCIYARKGLGYFLVDAPIVCQHPVVARMPFPEDRKTPECRYKVCKGVYWKSRDAAWNEEHRKAVLAAAGR